ncbi:MAG: LTA synthase family protein [Bacteroidetes bacterium]|nr:LTA synthase family protein [Bacteroidota bacterium]MCL2302522.1 LTA synthase family protein [Lentimicrobiaceae bacterium]
MKINHSWFAKILKPYLISVVLFISIVYLFKTIETFSFFKTQDATFLTILQSYFNITAVFCLYSLIILPFYLLIAFLNQKTAQILTSILFALLISLEIGLYVYYTKAGVLMGRELVIRPASETWNTIRGSSNVIVSTTLIIIVFVYFIALPFVLKKVKIFNNFRSSIIGIGVVGILSACTFFYQRDKIQITNNYLESKSFYFFSAIKNHSVDEMELAYFLFDEEGNFEKIEKNEKLLREYTALYNKTAEDLDYPMERSASEFPDVLSPYFKKSEKQPNIVIIMVESLGNYLLGEKGEDISFTPFLDSLANSGLYWKNCLTTTPRTFGVLPSVTGSLPHGMKGFQFGLMPNHYSLFTLLKNNNYTTNFFCGGNVNFDNMLDYLAVQDIDHIDNFMPQIGSYKRKKQANWYGLHDQVMFDKSLEYLKTLPPEKPKLNVYLTITTHDPFNLKEDKKLKAIYDAKTENLFLRLNAEQKKRFLPVKDRISGFIYIDDCIRSFIDGYAKLPDFENTIFIITGDHSVGTFKNSFDNHSVPLIIWSPMLKTHKTFPNIVSHFAIAPSIISFLQNNYNIDVPEKLSWCSTELDTASVYNPSEKFLFLSYDRKVNSMVYNQYYFEDKTNWSDRKLYEINENLDLEPIHDSKLMEQMYSKLKTLKYVNNYVYHNDKLIKADSGFDSKYVLIKGYENKNAIVCKTSDIAPSISGASVFDIMPVQKIRGGYDKIKIRFKADLIINDFVYQDKQMFLEFICSGKNYKYVSRENITKYILDDEILCNKKYELFIEKEIDVSDLDQFSVHICVTTDKKDENWEPDKKITISNVKVLIWGK